MRRLTRWAALFLVLGAAGCDDSTSTNDTTDTSTNDTTDTSTAEVAGSLVLSAAFEASAAKTGQNRLSITLERDTGEGVAGASITVVPTMPMMSHGSTETPVVTDLGDGLYSAFPVTFQMPGMWKIDIEAQHEGMKTELAFDVNVP